MFQSFLQLISWGVINRNFRLINTLTASLNTRQIIETKSASDSNKHIDPFASCSHIKQPHKILHDFITREDVISTALENEISKKELPTLLEKFAEFYSTNWKRSLEITVILSDIEKQQRHITDLLPHFLRFAFSHRSSKDNEQRMKLVTDELVANYHQSFLDARHFNRKVIMHVGATNSGKTYHAMQCYAQAESGVYAAPLRMLAYETYVRTNNKGIDCDMITGEESRYKHSADKPSAHISCTVEMVPTDMAMYKVGVIDEIQMIADIERGGAWTRALFGICCEELHVCGHKSAVDVVKRLLERTGEEVEVKIYDRLTPLTISPTHLNSDFSKLRPGDCIISFSRNKLHNMKAQVEVETGMKCSIIYGHLPPRVRMEQINLFNDPNSEYNIAVASDAIGLGVNLNIRRIVFDDFYKITKGIRYPISPQLANQIAGRAGRFLSIYPEGEVTTFHSYNYSLLNRLMSTPIPDIPKAVLTPPPDVWAKLDYMMPGNDMAWLLQCLKHALPKDSDYTLFSDQSLFTLSSLFKMIGVPNVSSLKLLSCFVNLKRESIRIVAQDMLSTFIEGRIFKYEDVIYSCSWPYPLPVTATHIETYEIMSEICDFYLWLHQRNPHSFPDRIKIRELRTEISRSIGDTLHRPCFSDNQEVYYFPDSDYSKRFAAYYESIHQFT